MHRKACIEQLEKHISSQEPWLLATKTLWSRTAMSLLMMDIIRSQAPNVSMVAYVDDTVLLGPAQDVAQPISARLRPPRAVSNCKKLKRKSGLPHKLPLTTNLCYARFKEEWVTKEAS